MLGAEKIQRIDYIGFSFNGVHSSQIGVYRITDGNRYNENLFPTVQDKVIQAPGADGTYFFNSYYTQKPINLSIGFDNLTESGLRELKAWLGEKQPARLIYDETPYKYHLVKITGTPNIKYLPFDEPCDKNDEGAYEVSNSYSFASAGTLTNPNIKTEYDSDKFYQHRVYKGEGTLSFVAYSPYAKNVYQYLDQFGNAYTNKNEWAKASGLLTTSTSSDGIDWNTPIFSDDKELCLFRVYNGGDYETDFRLSLIGFDYNIKIPSFTLAVDGEEFLQIDAIESADSGVRIDTHLQLIEGINSYNAVSGNIYNNKKLAGTFPKLPLGEHMITLVFDAPVDNLICGLEYNYLYL